jgi:hypothetical protein
VEAEALALAGMTVATTAVTLADNVGHLTGIAGTERSGDPGLLVPRQLRRVAIEGEPLSASL